MGRAIEHEKRIDDLEMKINELFLILEELSKVNTTQENIDLNEATKEKKANNEGSGDSDIKSGDGGSKKSARNNKNAKSSK